MCVNLYHQAASMRQQMMTDTKAKITQSISVTAFEMKTFITQKLKYVTGIQFWPAPSLLIVSPSCVADSRVKVQYQLANDQITRYI